MKGSKFQLVSQLVRGHWLIEQGFALEMLPMVARLLNGEPVSFYDTPEEENQEISSCYYLAREGSGRMVRMDYEDDLPENSIAVFQQRGVVMKEDYCGMAGTASIRMQFMAAMDNPKVGSAIFITDSPGGAVNGTPELADTLYNAKKPVVGFADGLSASAAYYILSGCNEIYASHASATIGSIGVLITLRDYTKYLDDLGIKDLTFVASTSPNKTAMYDEALKGNPEKIIKYLDGNDAIFMDAVRRTRTEVSDETMDGSVYLAEEAVDRDLIDGIETMERTIERALELSELQRKTIYTI